MSNAIRNLCWPLKMPPAAKAVLIVLADMADDAGICWPSIPTLSERTCLGRTAVIGAVKWLEQHRVMLVEHGRGVAHPNRYTVTPADFEPETSVSRTVREANGSSGELETSASRTRNVRQADPNHQESSRILKEGADAPKSVDPDKAMWDAGKALLGQSSGSLLGKLVKEHGKDVVMQAIAKTTAARPADPKTYLVGVLRKQSGPSMAEEFRRAI